MVSGFDYTNTVVSMRFVLTNELTSRHWSPDLIRWSLKVGADKQRALAGNIKRLVQQRQELSS